MLEKKFELIMDCSRLQHLLLETFTFSLIFWQQSIWHLPFKVTGANLKANKLLNTALEIFYSWLLQRLIRIESRQMSRKDIIVL